MTVESFTLPARPDAGAVARRRARAVAPEPLPHNAADTLYLLVNELVANALEHGEAPGPLEVRLTFHGGRGQVTVVDSGTGHATPADVVAPPRGAGLGLHVVEKAAERWGVSCDQRTRVWFEFSSAA